MLVVLEIIVQGISHRALAQSHRLKVLPVKLYDAVNGKVWR